MAIQFGRVERVSRSTGGNACCKGAYNARTIIKDGRTNVTYNFHQRAGNVYHHILLPEGVDAKFKDTEILTNAIEQIENRKNSQLLKEFVLALPDEKNISLDLKIEMVHDFVKEMEFVKDGLAVQIDIHEPHAEEKNWHAHLLITTRRFTEDGKHLGLKARDLDPQVRGGRSNSYVKSNDEINIGEKWKNIQNQVFEKYGLENRVDMIRSISQEHIGPVRMRGHLNEGAVRNEERIFADLETLNTGKDVLAKVTRGMSVFSKIDLSRATKCLPNVERAKQLTNDALSSKELLSLFDEEGKSTGLYTTREVRAEEAKLMRMGTYVADQKNLLHDVNVEDINQGSQVSKSQGEALDYLLSCERGLKVLKGRAGTGKSFVLGIVANTAKASKVEIIGLAPTHKAKLELQNLGYNKSDTVKGFLFKLHNNRVNLAKHSLIVVDEAAMVSNADYTELMRVAADRKCNVILAGDERQLSSIQRGGMFEVYADYFGSIEMNEIRRQEIGWSRDVASAFSKGQVQKGINILKCNGRLLSNDSKAESIEMLVADWSKSAAAVKDRLILAVKNSDVDNINKAARSELLKKGELRGVECFLSLDDRKEDIGYLPGDRIVFKETNKDVKVSNSDFGTIKHADNGLFKVDLDRGQSVSFNPDQFCSFKHGYASTVYKAQGATIEDVYVLHDGFSTLKNSYVAMSRHINDLHLYSNLEATKDEWSLAQQLQFSPEKRAGINYHTLEDLNKNTQGLEPHKNFLHEIAAKAYDYIHEKITEVLDKKVTNLEYYQIEPNHKIQQLQKSNQQQKQVQTRNVGISMDM